MINQSSFKDAFRSAVADQADQAHLGFHIGVDSSASRLAIGKRSDHPPTIDGITGGHRKERCSYEAPSPERRVHGMEDAT